MSSVNKILESRSKTPKDPKETKQLAEQMIGDLRKEGTIAPPPTTPPTSKRPVGRPRGSTSKSPSASRSRSGDFDLGAQMPIPPPQFPSSAKQQPEDNSPEAIANRMKCRRLIRKLRAYKRNFPELLGEDLAHVNPHACNYEQLTALIDSCKEVIGDEIESMTTPDIMGSILDSVEQVAVSAAMQADPESATKKLVHLQNFARAAKSDPCIALDMKLIACEWVGIVPQNPYFRLGLNLLRCAGNLMRENSMAAAVTASPENLDKYKEF